MSAARPSLVIPTWQSGPSHVLVTVLAFLATRLVALFAAQVALRDTDGLRHLGMAWDAEWYQHLAVAGYDPVDGHTPDWRFPCRDTTEPNCANSEPDRHSNLAFFPLFPLLIRAARNLGADPTWVAMGLAAVASLVAAVLIGELARRFAGPRFGVLAVVLWGVWPANIVLSSGRPEPLFVALATGVLLLTLDRKFVPAALLCAAAGLLRFQAIAVIVPLVAAAWVWGHRVRNWRVPAATTLIAPLGILAYLAFVGARMGTPTGWFDIQREWKSVNDWGAAKVAYLSENLLGPVVTHRAGAWTLVAALVLLLACIVIRVPWPLTLYAGILLGGVLVQAHFHQHGMRFLLVAFPLVFPLAWVMRRWPWWASVPALALLAAGSAVLQVRLWHDGLSF